MMHIIHLTCSLLFHTYFLLGYFIPINNNPWYKYALYCAITTYTIVLYKKYGSPQLLSHEYWMTILNDESCQYAILIMVLTTTYPQLCLLLPLNMYAIVHVVTYIRMHLLTHPAIRARIPSTTLQSLTHTCLHIHHWHSHPGMNGLIIMALLECCILPGCILSGSIGGGWVVMMFLKWRWVYSPVMQGAVKVVDGVMGQYGGWYGYVRSGVVWVFEWVRLPVETPPPMTEEIRGR
jgi:hypothetical protein